MKKVILFFALAGIMTANSLTAQTVIASGDCGANGNNLTWVLTASPPTDTMLTISGNGTMSDYAYNSMPWYAYRNSITSLVIGDLVTGIGNNAFYYCTGLTSITIPDSVTSIGDNAFTGCSSLTSVTIPNSVTSIGNSAFSACRSLQTVNYNAINCVTSVLALFSGDTAIRTLNIGNMVKSIPNNAFSNCSGLTSVTIPHSVTSIGSYAFNNCSGLTSVTIPHSVTSIGSSAFSNCSGLTSITIPDSVTSIGSSAFANCRSLQTVNYNAINCTRMSAVFSGDTAFRTLNIGNKVKSIPDYTFSNCSGLISISIPDSVTSIGNNAFAGCSSLTSITIPNSVTSIGSNVFQSCSSLTSITIPNLITSIGSYAFSNCRSLTSITIPNSVTFIGERAFYSCIGLVSVTIGDSVTSIGASAFAACSSLRTVNYNAINCTTIGRNVFSGDTAFRILSIGNRVKSIPDNVFSNCSSLQTVNYNAINCAISYNSFAGDTAFRILNIGNRVKSIPEYAFSDYTGLTSVTIGDSVTSIGDYAFYGCSGLTSITIPNLVTSIGDYAFFDCSGLISVTVGDSVTSIGTGAFYGCSGLTSIIIPNLVTSIGDYAFFDCSGLTSVTVGDSVTSIGSYAFSNCSGLTSIIIHAVTPPAGDMAFYNIPINIPVYIPCLSYNNYTRANGWSSFSNYIVNGPTSDTTFYSGVKCYNVPYTDNNFTAPVDWTGTYYATLVNASGCDSVVCLTLTENPYIPITRYSATFCPGSIYSDSHFSGLTQAGYYYDTLQNSKGCDSIIGLNLAVLQGTTASLSWVICDSTLIISGNGAIPDYSSGSMPWYPYQNQIKTVLIEDGVTSIGDNTFNSCTGLTSVTIPNSVTSIGDGAFLGCTGLVSVTIGDSVINIGDYAFSACTGMTSITLGNSIDSIGHSAFYNCTGLTSITIPENVTRIGENAFSLCISLDTVNYNAINCTRMGGYVYDPRFLWFYGDTAFTILTIGSKVERIPEYAFSDCTGLTSVIIGDSVISIGNAAFFACSSLSSITIPNLVTSIGDYAFLYCTGLTSVTIGNSVTSIGNGAFSGCNSLTSITIPNLVTSIGDNAFRDCSSLTSVTIHAVTPPVYGNLAFNNVPINIPVYIPCFSYDAYTRAIGWSSFSNYIVNGPTSDTTFYSGVKCYDVPYTDNNFTVPVYQAGTYYTTLVNASGCDSVVCLTLTENPYIPISWYSVTFCQGSVYSDSHFSGLTQAGYYYDTLQNSNGCDSIIGLDLTYTVSPVQELCMISVDENYHNEITWKQTDAVVSYNLYREGMQSGQYDLIANIPYESVNQWLDTASNARVRSYRYRISGIDTCGNESALSEVHRTMHLTISAGMNNSWNLIWTPYEGTAYATYNIYRSAGNTLGALELIGTMPSGNTSFSDFSAPAGYVYYMLEIVLNEPCLLTKSLSSIRSNIATNAPGGSTAVIDINTSGLAVYPNPVQNTLHLQSSSAIEQVSIYDISGRMLLQIANPSREVNISHLASGIYLVKVKTADGEVIRKIVKE